MPLGSSSEAPVTNPGPSFRKKLPRTGFFVGLGEGELCVAETTAGVEAGVVMGDTRVNLPISSRTAPRGFLDLLRQFVDGLDCHALDVHHFATQPSAEANPEHSDD